MTSMPSEDSDKKVYIDRTTEVPLELYLDLVEAGRRARARGQHHKARSRSAAATT